MDDLILECLVQIRGLADTPGRIEPLLAAATPEAWRRRPAADAWSALELLAHMADAELLFGVRLRLVLTAEQPPLPAVDELRMGECAGYREWSPELALGRFSTRRAESVELLRRCSAADLRRTGVHPRRGVMTVADLVAVMMTHDTDHLGEIRERIGLAGQPRQGA